MSTWPQGLYGDDPDGYMTDPDDGFDFLGYIDRKIALENWELGVEPITIISNPVSIDEDVMFGLFDPEQQQWMAEQAWFEWLDIQPQYTPEQSEILAREAWAEYVG